MARVYIGNLGTDCRESDIEKLFRDYGRVTAIDLKGVYGFINFEDKRDAADAIRDVDGKSFNGGRIRVDRAKERREEGGRGGGGGRDRDRGFGGGGRDGGGGGNRGGGGRGNWSDYRLLVENLSSRTSWQDLKDYMRKAGDITYTKTDSHSGEGVVEFADREGMEYALRKLDDTELDGRRIKLVEEGNRGGGRGGGGGGRAARSRSRSKGRGRRDKSGSKSRSRSVERKRSKGRSGSRETRSRSKPRNNRSRSRSEERKTEKSRSVSAERKEKSRTPEDRDRSRSRSKERQERSRSRST